jgi:hypothetical protein
MKTSPIPATIRAKAAKLYKAWPMLGHVSEIPESAIEAVTDGPRGTYKPGLKVWIVGGSERVVFLGPDKDLKETKLPEFTLLLESGAQFVGQYGRDFRFVE